MKNIFDNGFYKSQQLKKIGFKKIGNNVKISKNCLIIGIKNISISDNVRIDSFTSIIAEEGYLKIGNNVHIGGHSHILCSGGIIINNNCTISQGVKIYSQSDDYSENSKHGLFVKNNRLNYKKGKVNIGKYTIIGSGSVILPKVNIVNNCRIGALSLVNKNIIKNGIYAGIPCKKIKK
jgi:galactoside O-acetyltransferase